MTYLDQHQSAEEKTREWVSMRNKEQSEEPVATKREATKRTRTKTRAKEKGMDHQGLVALQENKPS